jgi:hypothetical protein
MSCTLLPFLTLILCIIFWNQATSSSQQTRPGTADKGVQCEILTSEGIMLPWEKLFTPHREKNTEHTMLLETSLQQNGVQRTAHRARRQTESSKRKDQNVEVKSKKHKSEPSPTVTHLRVSPRLAALNAQSETSIEPEDQPISIDHINQLQTVEDNNYQSKMSHSSTMNKKHGNEERAFNQLWSNQEDTVNRMQAMQENTTNHLQPRQVDTVNHIQMNLENTAHQLQLSLANTDTPVLSVHGYSTDQPSQADSMNHKQTNMENTVNQLQPSSEDTVNYIEMNQENTAHELQSSLGHTDIPIKTMQEYTTDQLSRAGTMNHIQSSLADTTVPIRSTHEFTSDHSKPSSVDSMNQIQANQRETADDLQFGQADTVTQIQMMQDNMTNQSNLADTTVPIRSTQEFTSDHSKPSSVDSMNQIQANQRATADDLQFGQADTVTQIQMMQDNMTIQSQLSQANSLNQIHINLQNSNNHLEPNYAENPLLQTGFSWDAEQNGGALMADFWRNVGSQDSSVPMQVDGVPVANFPANVKFQGAVAPAASEPVIPTTQATIPVTVPDQSGLVVPSLFGNAWSDPCLEFAFKTLTGDIPVLDDTAAVADYYPQQQDLNKGTTPNCSASALDNSRTHTQVDVNLPLPRPSDKLYNGSWFPPQ